MQHNNVNIITRTFVVEEKSPKNLVPLYPNNKLCCLKSLLYNVFSYYEFFPGQKSERC